MKAVCTLRITLETDVVLPARGATLAGERTLQRIPGSAIRGAAARLGYAELEASAPDDAFAVFHSGEVRFGDGHLLVDGERAFPMPLSLHGDKDRPAEPLFNLSRSSAPDAVQLRQQRGGLLTAGARRADPRTHYTMRTAVDRAGRAREGLLFGMEALARGQVFEASLVGSERHLAWLRKRLDGMSVRIGRSHNNEFGLVNLALSAPSSSRLPAGADERGDIVLWLTSDLALLDPATGSPRVVPAGADFGDGWALVPERTFLRIRGYSPFNTHWRRPGSSREVIAAGSVVTLRPSPGTSVAALRTRLAAGLGMHIEDGLGELIVDPELLVKTRVVLESHTPPQPAQASLPRGELAAWLQAQSARAQQKHRAEELARAWGASLRGVRVNRSQWGGLRMRAHLDREGVGAWLDEIAEGRGTAAARWNHAGAGRRLRDLYRSESSPDLAASALVVLAARMAKEE